MLISNVPGLTKTRYQNEISFFGAQIAAIAMMPKIAPDAPSESWHIAVIVEHDELLEHRFR